jgi:hypothetical protein
MPYLYDRSLVVWSFPFLIFLSGCSDKLECDSIETRKAVLQMVADDHRNPLANYAQKIQPRRRIWKTLNRYIFSVKE